MRKTPLLSFVGLVAFLLVILLPTSSFAGNLITCKSENCDWIADYLVVGSGAGGAPLMRRLSDDERYSVIGFEAGKYISDDPVISQGANMFSVYSSPNSYTWQMKTDFDTYMGKVNDIMMGEGSGGSTSINGMQYIRPSPQFGSVLEKWGGLEWNTAALQHAYKAVENYTVAEGSISSSRGTNGPLNARKPAAGPISGPGSIANVLAQWTAEASGIPITNDYNDYNNPAKAFGSFQRYQLFQNPEGNRESSVTAFLPKSILQTDGTSVSKRRQLRVLYEATVKKVIIEGRVAKGVIFELNGVTRVARARKEVILATNIFASQLLELSGVGRSDVLSSNGIPLVVANDHVGEHLMNHVSLTLPFSSNTGHFPGYPGSDFASIYSGGAFLPRWEAAGPLTNSSLLSDPRQFQLIWFAGFFNGLFVGPLQPKTEGTEHIQSRNPLRVPRHDEKTFSATEDLDDLAKFMFHFVQNTLFEYLHAKDPAYDIGWVRWNNIDEVKTYIKVNLSKTLHYCGHTRMARTASKGVVDPRGRVFGVKGLRVAGAAALPVPPDSTPASLAMIHGWKIADFIIADR